MYNGIINVYKESGFTSHDVVAKLRGILHQKKIGHTGTLDPEATGVLPVCLGNATRLCDMITDKSKEYRAVLLLGISTDTEDATGKILSRKAVNVTAKDIEKTVNSFVGKYNQVPPMYSALKVNGQKLCDLARKGVEIERKPREVFIYDIIIEKIDIPEVTMTVKCSKGTYIRSLCRDIGEKLNIGGTMKSLVRTRTGIFNIENAVRLSEISKCVADNNIASLIMPTDSFFDDYPAVNVSGRNEMLVKNGNMIILPEFKGNNIKVYLSDGVFAGIYGYDEVSHSYKPKKMFPVQ